jgi:hypothetical protein
MRRVVRRSRHAIAYSAGLHINDAVAKVVSTEIAQEFGFCDVRQPGQPIQHLALDPLRFIQTP